MKHLRKVLTLTLLTPLMILTGCNSYSLVTLEAKEVVYTYKDYFSHNYENIDTCPSIGSPKLLVVPVWFTDSGNYISDKTTTRNRIQSAYFGKDTETGWRSVSSYYDELSGGRVKIGGTVSSWYECGKPSSYYYDSVERTMQLVNESVNWYKDLTGDNMTSFDYDKNGYLDGVMLIYGSPDYQRMRNQNASNMWAYCYWLAGNKKNTSSPNANAFFWASYDFMDSDTRFAKIDTHTYIHEMGHVFGLNDYYDYSGQYVPAGGFSMQDYNVGSHDPHSVLGLGWANALVPTKSCKVELHDFQSSKEVIILSPNYINSPFDEYLILELYTPRGLNEFDAKHRYEDKYPLGPSGTGIRLWHVDARLLEVKNHRIVDFSNKIEDGKQYTMAMSNTYYGSQGRDYISSLGKDYADYNILQLIRNNKKETYQPKYAIGTTDLFKTFDSFSMSEYKSQFVKSKKLNNGKSLGWSFKVNSVTEKVATITLIKG